MALEKNGELSTGFAFHCGKLAPFGAVLFTAELNNKARGFNSSCEMGGRCCLDFSSVGWDPSTDWMSAAAFPRSYVGIADLRDALPNALLAWRSEMPYTICEEQGGRHSSSTRAKCSQVVTWIQTNDNLIPATGVGASITGVRDPAVIVYDQMYGFRPTAAQLDGLHMFQQDQHEYALSIGVPNPTLYVYEAFGQALSHGPAFTSQYNSGVITSDIAFATAAWLEIFDQGPTPELIKFVTDHVDFYEAIYLASGAFGSDLSNIGLLARGATYGLIIGIAEQAGIATNSADLTDGVSLVGVAAIADPTYSLGG